MDIGNPHHEHLTHHEIAYVDQLGRGVWSRASQTRRVLLTRYLRSGEERARRWTWGRVDWEVVKGHVAAILRDEFGMEA